VVTLSGEFLFSALEVSVTVRASWQVALTAGAMKVVSQAPGVVKLKVPAEQVADQEGISGSP
jgi:hypothetical protein